ncbi:hypothetical protein OPQ81_007955 [Rhizoctonia solani]|nr:hypothetical protein OPQ81_007955 [Rhizoctonia solani]
MGGILSDSDERSYNPSVFRAISSLGLFEACIIFYIGIGCWRNTSTVSHELPTSQRITKPLIFLSTLYTISTWRHMFKVVLLAS